MKELVKKLVESAGPSGFEHEIRAVVRAEIEGLADEITVDALGNLIARVGPRPVAPAPKKIMLAAHIDEIGVIATHIDENGFVRFTTVGGVRPHTCISGRVRFMNGARGVIGMEKLDSPTALPTIEQLYIDLGVSSAADSPVKVGDTGIFDRPFEDLGKRWVAKSMDDRVCAAILIETMRRLKTTPNELYFVFTTQEEVGTRGATTAAYGIDPDLGLAVDVTGVGDTPKGPRMAVGLGKGPAIKVRDAGMLADPRVVRWMVDAAEKAGLPYQMEVLEGGSTDARAIQMTRAGVPAGCLSIPTRYIHSPSEMVDSADVENSVRLLLDLVSNPVDLK